jgi:hypothetical protein
VPRTFLSRSIVLASALGLAACSQHQKPYSPPPPERLSVPLDAGAWVVGFRDMNAPGELVEYVPRGQSVDKWSELFTERTFPNLQETTTPEKSFAEYKKTTTENCPGAKWNLIENDDEDVVYELATSDCKETRPPYEIGRFLSGDRALYTLVWQTKSPEVDQKTKDGWISTLADSEVVPY